MSAPGKVSMLPTLVPPMPVPTKVLTSWLGDMRASWDALGSVVESVDDPGVEPDVAVLGAEGPHALRTAVATATMSRPRRNEGDYLSSRCSRKVPVDRLTSRPCPSRVVASPYAT